MKNKIQNLVPCNTKFLKPNLDNEEDILLEFLIAELIHQGASFKAILMAIDIIQNKKEKDYMTEKITNLTLDFIAHNPKSAEVLKQNDRTHQFLNLIGL